jgi:hypothetical protein
VAKTTKLSETDDISSVGCTLRKSLKEWEMAGAKLSSG